MNKINVRVKNIVNGRKLVIGNGPSVRLYRANVTPNQISNLKQWLKADALSLSDTNAVSSWTESSGNGVAAIQATGSKQPLYRTNRINGKPTVKFDGTDDSLTMTYTQVAANGTVCMVVGNWTTNVAAVNYAYRNNAGSRTYLSKPLNSNLMTYSKGNTSSVAIGTYSLINTAFVYVTIVWKTVAAVETADLYVNGTAIATNIATTLGSNGATGWLGSFDGTQQYGNVEIAEFIHYEKALSTTERQSVDTYLRTKYGL
jgi:hypothetical protein